MTYSHKPARKGVELLHNINGTTPRPQLPTNAQGTRGVAMKVHPD